jgi:hypothetical protein
MSTPKNYFLVPNHDLPVGFLQLGVILLNPLDPNEVFNEGEVVDIPALNKHTSHKYDWEHVVEDANDGRVGVWARFINVLGLGGTFGANFDVKTVVEYKFRDLETTFFNPSSTYVEDAVKQPAVLAFLKACSYKLPLYMITGLKVVRGPGAAVIERNTQVYGGHARMGISAPFGSPYAFDTGDLSGRQENLKDTAFRDSSDFIFAYRLSRITFKTQDGQPPVARPEKYRTGALLGVNSEREEDDHVSGLIDALIIEGEEAIRQDLSEMEWFAAIDENDEGECQCYVVPLQSRDNLLA